MSTVKAANLQNTGSGAPAFKNSSGTEIGQLCKAWVNFDGTGTVSISDSFNIASITDNGTGKFGITVTTAFSDTNYCIVFGGNRYNPGNDVWTIHEDATSSRTTTAFDIWTNQATNSWDSEFIQLAVFGD